MQEAFAATFSSYFSSRRLLSRLGKILYKSILADADLDIAVNLHKNGILSYLDDCAENSTYSDNLVAFLQSITEILKFFLLLSLPHLNMLLLCYAQAVVSDLPAGLWDSMALGSHPMRVVTDLLHSPVSCHIQQIPLFGSQSPPRSCPKQHRSCSPP